MDNIKISPIYIFKSVISSFKDMIFKFVLENQKILIVVVPIFLTVLILVIFLANKFTKKIGSF